MKPLPLLFELFVPCPSNPNRPEISLCLLGYGDPVEFVVWDAGPVFGIVGKHTDHGVSDEPIL